MVLDTGGRKAVDVATTKHGVGAEEMALAAQGNQEVTPLGSSLSDVLRKTVEKNTGWYQDSSGWFGNNPRPGAPPALDAASPSKLMKPFVGALEPAVGLRGSGQQRTLNAEEASAAAEMPSPSSLEIRRLGSGEAVEGKGAVVAARGAAAVKEKGGTNTKVKFKNFHFLVSVVCWFLDLLGQTSFAHLLIISSPNSCSPELRATSPPMAPFRPRWPSRLRRSLTAREKAWSSSRAARAWVTIRPRPHESARRRAVMGMRRQKQNLVLRRPLRAASLAENRRSGRRRTRRKMRRRPDQRLGAWVKRRDHSRCVERVLFADTHDMFLSSNELICPPVLLCPPATPAAASTRRVPVHRGRSAV